MYQPIPGAPPEVYDVEGRENLVGPKSVATPGSLRAWCLALRPLRYDVARRRDAARDPARQRAASPSRPISPTASPVRRPTCCRTLSSPTACCPTATPLKPGERLVQGDYAEALTLISQQGEEALHGGPLGDLVVECMERSGGFVGRKDLTDYRVVERKPIRGQYRGWEIVGPPPPAASGVHITQMLNILEGYDIAGLGFGTVDTHPSARRGAEDRLRRPRPGERRSRLRQGAGRAHHLQGLCPASAAPASISPARGAGPAPCASWKGRTPRISPSPTAWATSSATTQTINSLFGARFIVPGTGMVPNNYMSNFDPRPGNALSIAPGKRVTTSMSPMMALRDGRVVYALGLPGGRKIFPAALQALINLIDHGMALQEAVEAPRVWTEGLVLEVEHGIPESVRQGLQAPRSHAAGDADGGGRHERHPVPRRRQHDRRRLLARRRLAGRPGRRAGAPRRAVRVAALIDATR